MWVESNGDGVERRRFAKIKRDPRILIPLSLTERGHRFGATSARIEDHRVVARVDDLGRVVVLGILQLSTHARA
jgi:hypothetical protein